MPSHRREQLSSLIQQELGRIIAKEIEFPQGVLATISSVELSKDFGKAAVWVSVIPEESGGEVLKILEKARGFLRHELGEKLRVRVTPRVGFTIDHGGEYAARIEKISLDESDSS